MAFGPKKTYLATLLLVDGLAVSCAWLFYYYLRIESGLFERATIPEVTMPMIVIGVYWFLLFWISGLYRPWYAQSRVDELIVVGKTITIGVVILFFLVFIDDTLTRDPASSRLRIAFYWIILVALVGAGRMALRSLRRRVLMAGIGHRKTLLIGARDRAVQLAQSINGFPALGYNIVGYISPDENGASSGGDNGDLPRIGTLPQLENAIREHGIEELIVALDSTEHELLLDIIGRCSEFKVGIKIRPDLYDIVSGQARTNQLYGIPLIEVTPQLMTPWERFMKRTIDIGVSLIVVITGIPLFLLVAIAQKLTSRGPVFYSQERVGKDGRKFLIRKFRTMYADAERRTGPRWAQKDDPRVTPFGRFLRKTHIDELPQVINVLDGDMSLVGPRPERPFFVEQFVREIPLYRRRLNVRPGITGWAQVKHTYDQSIDDVRTKLSYDLFYIENMSIRMDIKIILNTMYNVIAGKGHT